MQPSTLLAPICPFPNVYWWSKVLYHQHILLDTAEHFEKMSLRNRYLISNATGVLSLSIPLTQGRQQRKPMCDVLIDNTTPWQSQHWRSIKTAYNRSPYFEHFEQDLQLLFTKSFEHLVDFGLTSISLISQLISQKIDFQLKTEYQKNCDSSILDIRGHFKANKYDQSAASFPVYAQVFDDRLGFLPNLSLLDLLFAEAKMFPHYLPK